MFLVHLPAAMSRLFWSSLLAIESFLFMVLWNVEVKFKHCCIWKDFKLNAVLLCKICISYFPHRFSCFLRGALIYLSIFWACVIVSKDVLVCLFSPRLGGGGSSVF